MQEEQMQQFDETSSNSIKPSSRGRCPDGAPNPIDVYVGNRIRLRRTLLGYSQEKLASKLGVKFQQLQKYERGRNRLSASRLWDVSRILRVDVNFFFEDMPLEIAKQSPRMMYGDCDEDKELDRAPFPGTKETSTEAQELLRMYFKISNREIAGQIFDLMHSLSKSPYHYNSEKQSDSPKNE